MPTASRMRRHMAADRARRSRLGGDDADIGVVGRYDNRVCFRLRTAEQIAAFRDAINGPLAQTQFLNTVIPGDDAESEGDGEAEEQMTV